MKKRKVFAAILLTIALIFSMGIAAYSATVLPPYENKATASTVTIDNKFIGGTTTAGTITLSANTFATGDVVTILDAKKVKLGDITITDPTKAYSLDVTTLTRKAGTIGVYVTPASKDFAVSKTVVLKYLAQKSPVVDPTAISIAGKADTPDVLTMTGIEAGDKVNIYPATAIDTDKKPMVRGVSKGTSVDIKLGNNNISQTTGIKVSIIKKDCTESDKLLIKDSDLNYTAPPVSSDITAAYVIKSAARISGLAPSELVNIYNADPSQYLSKYPSKEAQAALKAILIGTKKAGPKDSSVMIAFKNGVSPGAKVYITRKTAGKSVSAAVSVAAREEISGTMNAYVLTSSALISALAPKDKVNIYNADPTQYLKENPSSSDKAALKAILVGSGTIGAKGYVSINFKTALTAGSTVYITKQSTGQSVSAPIEKQVQSDGGTGGIGTAWAWIEDKLGFDYDGMGILRLSAPAAGNSHKYIVPDGVSYFVDPKEGDNVAGWKSIVDGATLDLGFNAAQAKTKVVWVAEVDVSNIIVKVAAVSPTNIADYTLATCGTLTGTVAIANDQFIIGNPVVDSLMNGQDRTFTITFDGGTTVTVTYPAASTNLKGHLISQINAVIAVPGGPGVAQYDSSGHIQIISANGGASSKVRVGGRDAALFFGSSPTIVDGRAEAH